MKIVFDLDNTLVDELGKNTRPGIEKVLELLSREGHELILWTNSSGIRAREILRRHKLTGFFKKNLFREDYDPENRGLSKDISSIGGELFFDDDPEEISFNRRRNVKAILVSPFRAGNSPEIKDSMDILSAVLREQSFLNRMRNWLHM